jgi:outer membrane protein OmpA-like peptidoglycan-associated protein
MNSLSLDDDPRDRPPLDRTSRERARSSGGSTLPLLVLLIAAVLAALFFGYRQHQRNTAADARLADLSAKVDQATATARAAMDKATTADQNARAAAEGRHIAETQAVGARLDADLARQASDKAQKEAISARETAARAEAEKEAIRKRAESERNRLEAALGEIAETRKTALGLVMNLGGDHLKFEFNKADLIAKDRELLSRIAGILLTAQDYTISVNGHTDDVGSVEYNQALSQRRAQAVRDYLVQAGIPAGILSVTGHGKSLPLVRGTTDAARAKNRRVELAIANTHIRYGP